MPARKLREFLDNHHVKYTEIKHSPAFTAQEIAASAHIPGKELAKTVIVHIDDELAMVVVPASDRVDLEQLRADVDARKCALATEAEFEARFPGCELGAMPPFGNLYGMKVFVSDRLAEDEYIAFNAGTHKELFRLAYSDFAQLVEPKVEHFAV